MSENLGYAAKMGSRLRSEVERQLLEDLGQYGVDRHGLRIDWSDTCPEAHVTKYLGGTLESWSYVGVLNREGSPVAEGWIEFIHGGGDNPLFVFWELLNVAGRQVKKTPGIPQHIWDRLPEATKDLCSVSDKYDARWSEDPLVIAWKSRRSV